MPEQALTGIRVLDFTHHISGPYCTKLLADYGAEVIKVESMSRMDMTRGPASLPEPSGDIVLPMYPNGEPGERPWNRNAQFNACNAGKYGVTLDLSRPKGLKAFMRLVRVSNIFFSNLAVGVAEKLGITHETLVEENPEIIYLSSSGYGGTGPYADRVAMGNTIDGAAGLFGLRDYGDGDGTAVTPDTHCDTISALTNAIALVMALYHREKTGSGIHIDASMAEPCPHLKERGFFDVIEEPAAGVHTCPGRPWQLEETETPERRHAPLLGEHNDYVLGEIAGLTPDEILELAQDGVVGTIPDGIQQAPKR